jgi:tetratricopeptide (TPR) repeat protein
VRSAPRGAVLVCLFVLALSASAFADIVYLTNGTKVEGEVTDLGDSIRVRRTSGITVVYPKSMVLRIERRSSDASEYRKRSGAVEPDDAKGLLGLARWCREKGLKTEAEAAYREVLGIASPLYREAKWEFAKLLEGTDRLMEAWTLYEELGAEARDKAVSMRARLDQRRDGIFYRAKELLAGRKYREALSALVQAYQCSPRGDASQAGAVTEADLLGKLIETRRLYAGLFATSRLTVRPCAVCSAASTVTCPTCKGEGKVRREFIVMDPREGMKKVRKLVTCETCRGAKKVRCTSCKGLSANVEGLEGLLKTTLRSLADRAFEGTASSPGTGIRRLNRWIVRNRIPFGEGAASYAKSKPLRKLLKGVPPSAEEIAAVKGAWGGADPEARGNFLACYGLELAKLLSLLPRSALERDAADQLAPPAAAEAVNAVLVSALPHEYGGRAFRIPGIWKGVSGDEEGAVRVGVNVDTGGPHALYPFLWKPAAKAIHERLGRELGLSGFERRAGQYPYAELEEAIAKLEPGDRVELAGRFYCDERPAPEWCFEVWRVALRPDEEIEKAVALLSKRVTFRFEDTPLGAGIEMLSELAGVRMALDVPEGLEINVAARVRRKPLGRALNEILQPFELSWAFVGGGLRITARASERERERAAMIMNLLPPAEPD